MTERTFSIIKPDATRRNLTGKINAVIEDAGIDPSVVDDVILGNANGAGEENRNVARMAWLLAGFPDTVPGITVNRLCASGMSAIGIATAMVRSGMADVVVAGGVESMSRAPWVMEKPTTAFAKPGAAFDTAIGWRFVNPRFADGEFGEKFTFSMPETAEEVGEVDGITREDADAFAAFEETGDVFDPATAEKLRSHIYAAGGTRDPEELYTAFRGKMPSPEAMMEKRGLA